MYRGRAAKILRQRELDLLFYEVIGAKSVKSLMTLLPDICRPTDSEWPATRPSGTSSMTAWLTLPFRLVNQMVIFRACAFRQPRCSAHSRCSPLHGAYLHVADDIGQHFDQAKQNDKRHHAENHYCQHGPPRNSLHASLSKTEPDEYSHTDEP